MSAMLALCLPAHALADASVGFEPETRAELPPYLQCVPYARQLTGIRIFGDAHTWWEQAAGRYERGNTPRVGAVMAFVPHRNMTLGHVAAVSRVIDSRTVLLDHANWSPIDGRRGQIERNVRAIDVSPSNDWSEVRVWYHPLQALGKTAWPVHGFIYGEKAKLDEPRFVVATRPATSPPAQPPVSRKPSPEFASAFADLARAPAASQPAPRRTATAQPRRTASAAPRQRDPINAALARYE